MDRIVSHLDAVGIAAGDTVIGTLPVNLAAEVCARGGRYVHLSLRLPREARGEEMSTVEMCRFGATLEEFKVQRVMEDA